MTHIPDEILEQKLAEAVKLVAVGSQYRHYRGGEYQVLQLALQEGTEEVAVVYQNSKNSLIWVRSLNDWQTPVTLKNSQTVQRFQKIT